MAAAAEGASDGDEALAASGAGAPPPAPGSESGAEALAPAPGSESGAEAPAPGATPVPSADIDEEDLFGSDDDAGEALAAPAAAGGAAGGDAGALATAAVDDLGDIDGVDEKELFGSGDEGEADVDAQDLFGEEGDDAAPAAGVAAEGAERPAETPEPSEMDEREIFGDVSEDDEEPQKVEDVTLMRRPQPGDDRVYMSLRLPNVLSVETRCFRPGMIPQSLLEGHREFVNTRGKTEVKLLTAENCIRWRFKRDEEGELVNDEDGRPQYESNSRIVEWEDGSKTLFVGKEVFNLSQIAEGIHLFEENSQEIHVCHGSVKTRLIATPQSLNSATHESLKRSQYKKFEPSRRSLLQSREEQDARKQLDELESEQRRRQEQRHKRTAQQVQMGAEFLEDGASEGAAGPSIADAQRAFKEETKRLRNA